VRKLANKVSIYLARAFAYITSRYGATSSTLNLVKRHCPKALPNSISLDLGCGPVPNNPFQASMVYGIDIREDLSNCNRIKRADLSKEPIPFEDNHFDYLTAYDFLEHVPRIIDKNGSSRLAFVELMNEIHRVLKPRGLFLSQTPAFPAKAAFQDPTHVNIITEDTFPLYFSSPNTGASIYGFKGNFELLDQKWKSATWIVCLLRAIK
jgi:SAM-dependent methyltransferase